MTSGAWGGLFLLALIPACARCGAPSRDELLVRSSTELTFGDVANLGPHRLEAVVVRGRIRDGEHRETAHEDVVITWLDWDHFAVRRTRDRRTQVDVVVDGGTLYRPDAGGAWVAGGDAESWRVQLRLTWDVWETALGPVQDHLRLVPDGGTSVEGREARKFLVELVPPVEGRSRIQPVSATGTVWLDATTAARLSADVTARWKVRGRDEEEEVRLLMMRNGFGGVALPPLSPEGE